MKIKSNIKTKFLNNEDEEVTVKLPKHYKLLRNQVLESKYNLGIEVSEDKPFNAEQFGEVLYTVTNTEVRNFEIEEPTNLFYLNVYFDIVKTRNLSLPKEETIITTEKLKEMIADLLYVEKEDLKLQEIYNLFLTSKDAEGKRIKTNKKPKEIEDHIILPKGATLAPEDSGVHHYTAEGKPIFTVEKLRNMHKRKQEEYRKENK